MSPNPPPEINPKAKKKKKHITTKYRNANTFFSTAKTTQQNDIFFSTLQSKID